MLLEKSTIETIQSSSSSMILEEFSEWYEGNSVAISFSKSFNDINIKVPHQLKVIIVALKLFMDEYGEEPNSTVKINVEY